MLLLSLFLSPPDLTLVLVLGQVSPLEFSLAVVARIASSSSPAEVLVALSAGLGAGEGQEPGSPGVPK